MSCEYCNSNGDDDGKKIVSITNDDVSVCKSGYDAFRLDYRDDYYGIMSDLIKFNNCPMCGKKLEGVDSDE